MPDVKVLGLTAAEYVRRHGGEVGDKCTDAGVDWCVNRSGGGKPTWLRGRDTFGRGTASPRLRATCSGPCRVPGSLRLPPRPVASAEWARLDQLGRSLYSQRAALRLGDPSGLPALAKGVVVARQLRPGPNPAGQLTGVGDPAIVCLFVAAPEGTTDKTAAQWFRRHPLAGTGPAAWIEPSSRARALPVSTEVAALSAAPAAGAAEAGAAQTYGLGVEGLARAYQTSREFAAAYAAAWQVTRRQAIAQWLDVYDDVVALEWSRFDPGTVVGPVPDPATFHAALVFLTDDSLAPNRVDLAAPPEAAPPEVVPPEAAPPAPPEAAPPEVAPPATPAGVVPAAPAGVAPAAPAGVAPAGVAVGARNSGIVANNSTVIIINGGSFDPTAGGIGLGDRRPEAPVGRRMPWSWWCRESQRLLIDRQLAAKRLLAMDTEARDDALRWLINERGLTYETGMAGDEYVLAAASAAERDRAQDETLRSTAPVPRLPDPVWSRRVPHLLAPIGTLMCLDHRARQQLANKLASQPDAGAAGE